MGAGFACAAGNPARNILVQPGNYLRIVLQRLAQVKIASERLASQVAEKGNASGLDFYSSPARNHSGYGEGRT